MICLNTIDILAKHHQKLVDMLGSHNLWLVGGCIRDVLLNIVDQPYDVDLTGAGGPSYRLDQTKKSGCSYFHTEKFGTITLLPKDQTNDGKEIKYELTPLRVEGGYQDFRHPEEIKRSDDIVTDSIRRDFTINCLYYYHITTVVGGTTQVTAIDISEIDDTILTHTNCVINNICIVANHDLIAEIFAQGKINNDIFEKISQTLPYFSTNTQKTYHIDHIIIDPHGGMADMIRGKIKTVGPADKRFQEDALRILRGIRFVNTLNQKLQEHAFDFEPQTYKSMKKNRYLVQRVAKERIHDELIKIFEADNPFGYIALLDDLHLLELLFPHIYRCKGVDQPVRYHPFDIYAHTMLTLYNLQQLNTNYLVKIAMLYHDVGKVDQYHTYKLGLGQDEVREIFGTWLNHINSGVDMARKDLSNLGFSHKEIEIVGRYILNHMVPGQILDAKPEQQPKKLRKLLSEVGYEQVNNLLDLCLGDRMGHYNPLQAPALDGVYKLKEILQQLYQQEGQFTMKELCIDGTLLMQTFDISPGPQIKILLQDAFDRVSEDIAHRNQQKIIITYLQEKHNK